VTEALGYIIADVFTDRPFGGNPLAIFPDGESVSPDLMQAIAGELNLSETVFVLPPTVPGATHRLRIFTPAVELPFAGHPTIGTAIALTRSASSELRELVFEEGAGLVRVEVDRAAGMAKARLTSPQLPVRVTQTASASEIAAAIGLSPEALGPVAARAYSAGVPFTFIPVADEDALSSARLDTAAWQTALAESAAPHLYLFTTSDWRSGREIHARMFAPAMGIAEDPATGGAAAALAGFLADIQDLPAGRSEWRIRQGYAMGRPSEIELGAIVDEGKLRAVTVGGGAVLIGEGALSGALLER
jgi:trans-2,3-dihydro-3-hydroxyanthranilate isomerase